MRDTFELKSFLILWMVGAILAIALIAWLTWYSSSGHGWYDYYRLTQNGAIASAAVTDVQPKNHCRLDYVFSINSVDYKGRDTACSADIGNTVSVTYLLVDPSVSCLGSARTKLNNELVSFVLIGLFFPPFVIWSWRRRREFI